MDIDTRRANGLYSRLDVSQTLQDLISETFTKLYICKKYSMVRLGNNTYKILRSSLVDEDEIIRTHQLYIVEHIENSDDSSIYLMETYDIPREIDDLWIIYPMSVECYEPKVYVVRQSKALHVEDGRNLES
jgi:hypothetical protein